VPGRLACPSCGAEPKLADDLLPKKIECRKCGTLYPRPADDEDDEDRASRPRRKANGGSTALLLTAIGVSAVVLLLVCLGAPALVFLIWKTTAVAQAPKGHEPMPAQGGMPPGGLPPGGLQPGGAPPDGAPKSATDVGMTALAIDGEDIEGKRFKLADYRGKVVMLDFWGQWCPHCRTMYPHNRSLVTKLADKPFVLLGVNSDPDRKAVASVVAQEKITWRSFWNDGSPNGPIARAWNIQGWPTVFLIDHKGVIRQKYVGAPPAAALERAIDDLIKGAAVVSSAPRLDRSWDYSTEGGSRVEVAVSRLFEVDGFLDRFEDRVQGSGWSSLQAR
jgi:thiol-disulfide isomerase/thioredoxin